MPEHTPAPTPSRGIYGFVIFLLFKTLFILYTLWAFIPTSVFENYLGITYLPDKYFAVFVPILVLTATNLFGFLIYPSLTLITTPEIDDKATIIDEYSVRRCNHRDSQGVLCDIKLFLENDKKWDCSEYCKLHQQGSPYQSQVDNKKNYIADFCDCPDKKLCLLEKNKNYVKELRALKHIPNAADLEISDVSRTLYL